MIIDVFSKVNEDLRTCSIPHLGTYKTMSSAIFAANFPTLVPPNFWTIHLASGSIAFWYMFGGVDGGREDKEEDREQEGDDWDDIVQRNR